MRKVNFISSPLTSGHAVRGVGFYVKNLLSELKRLAPDYDIEVGENMNNPDLNHFPFFDLFSTSLAIMAQSKTVVTVHDVIPLEFPEHYPAGLRGSLNQLLQKMAIRNVDMVITDSMASVQAIHKFLGIPHEKIKLIYLAAAKHFQLIKNKTELQHVATKYKLPKKFVLYVGDMNWNKNIPGLVEACKQADMPLVIVGKQAAELAQLKSQVPSGPQDVLRKLFGKPHPQLAHLDQLERLFIEEKVLCLGFVPDADLVALYNLAHVYCQPSFAEGFGLPVLEALACGTAVACSNAHSLPEVAGDCATYFDPHDTLAMANAIRTAKKVDSAEQIAKFSWEKTARATLEAYCTVLGA